MGKIIFICGKICSGKSMYTKKLLENMKAVVLSTDEILLSLSLRIPDSDEYDKIVSELQYYLFKKAEEIISCGTTVIFDGGFGLKRDRESVSKYFSERSIRFEWHYIDISDEDWKENIKERNMLVREKKVQAYYVDEGLLQKMISKFEKPSKDAIDVWIAN